MIVGRPRPCDDGVEDRRPRRKIFIDHNMNRSGANISAAYSGATRAAGAPSRHRSRGTRCSRAGSTAGLPSTTWDRFERPASVRRCAQAMDLTHASGARRGGRGRVSDGAHSPHGGALHAGEDVGEWQRPGDHAAESVRRRDRTRAAGRRGGVATTSHSFAIRKHPGGTTALRHELGRTARSAGRCPKACPRRETTSGSRCAPRTIRWNTARSGDPRGLLRRGRGPHLRRQLFEAWSGPFEGEPSCTAAVTPTRLFGETRTDDRVPGDVGAVDPVPERQAVCWPRADGRRSTMRGGGSSPLEGSRCLADPPRARPSCGPGGRDVWRRTRSCMVRARRPGERGDRRRDRGLRSRAGRSRPAATDEPAGPAAIARASKQIPVALVVPHAVARRPRHHRARPEQRRLGLIVEEDPRLR